MINIIFAFSDLKHSNGLICRLTVYTSILYWTFFQTLLLPPLFFFLSPSFLFFSLLFFAFFSPLDLLFLLRSWFNSHSTTKPAWSDTLITWQVLIHTIWSSGYVDGRVAWIYSERVYQLVKTRSQTAYLTKISGQNDNNFQAPTYVWILNKKFKSEIKRIWKQKTWIPVAKLLKPEVGFQNKIRKKIRIFFLFSW